ncbi:MAG: LemA family protein [Actinobacteria bacterium]|nr:LemA family protein [Actinomycetota bacterium]
MEILLIVLGIAAVVGIYLWITYNALVALKIRVDEAWSDITVQLKRRADLIPNLIETVRGYASHEREVFENVTKARAATVSPESLEHPAKAAQAEGMLQGALKSLFAVSEAYPQLVASTNFLELQRELTDTEDKIMASRRFFNGGVRELNTKIVQFPNNVFAGGLGFTERATNSQLLGVGLVSGNCCQ